MDKKITRIAKERVYIPAISIIYFSAQSYFGFTSTYNFIIPAVSEFAGLGIVYILNERTKKAVSKKHNEAENEIIEKLECEISKTKDRIKNSTNEKELSYLNEILLGLYKDHDSEVKISIERIRTNKKKLENEMDMLDTENDDVQARIYNKASEKLEKAQTKPSHGT